MNQFIKFSFSQLSKVALLSTRANVEDSRNLLEAYSPRPSGNCKRINRVDLKYDLQIIVPAYNAEKYIIDCLESVLGQKTDYTYVVTVIDDGSKDSTLEILKKYKKNHHVEIIHQENKGFSGARNRGMELIKGEYITFLDSDDMFCPGAIQSMLSMARSTNADIIQGGWHEFGNDHDEVKCPNAKGMIDSSESIFSGYPWGKLIKYSVLENFQFPEGFWFEDTPFSFLLEAMPLKFAATSEVIYKYRINPKGITQKAVYSKKAVDSYWITELCLKEFPEFNLQYDQRAYDYFLHQVIVNYLRTRKMPAQVRKAIFVLSAECMKKYFTGSFKASDQKFEIIEKALKNYRYMQYELAMLAFR